MAKDTLRLAADHAGSQQDQMRDGTVTGSAAKGYANFMCDGSSYDKYGNRVDLSQVASTQLK